MLLEYKTRASKLFKKIVSSPQETARKKSVQHSTCEIRCNIRENISSILPLILGIWLLSVLKWFSIYCQEWFRSRFSSHNSTILAPLSQPIKIHHNFRAQDFPRLVTDCMHFLWILIGSRSSLFLLWLAGCIVSYNAENRLINDECQL